jgi:hypothetical protein
VCQSTQLVAHKYFESKIDRALINDHCEEIVWLDGVPYHRAAGTFIGTARRRQSTFGGNDSTTMPHPEQLLYDGATTHRGQGAFVGSDSTTSRHQEELFLSGDVPSRRRQSTFGGNNSMKMRHPEQLLYDGATTR